MTNSEKNIRVLLVDDEKDFADILSKRLEVRNVFVKCAYNGDDALVLINTRKFDVVLLDVMMPGKGGLELLKEIKAIHPLIHIIMLTGHARVETAIEGMELGAYDYLIKPADTEELMEKIELAYSHKIAQEERKRLETTVVPKQKRGWETIWGSIAHLFQRKPSRPLEADPKPKSGEKSRPSDTESSRR